MYVYLFISDRNQSGLSLLAVVDSTERPDKKHNPQQERQRARQSMQAQSCDATRAGSDITGFCGRPGRHSASPGAEQPDRHAGGPEREGTQSSCPHPLSLLPAPSLPKPSPGPRSWPGSCSAPTAAAHVSVGGEVSRQGPVCKSAGQKRNRKLYMALLQNLNSERLKVTVRTLASLSASREPPVCSCRRA